MVKVWRIARQHRQVGQPKRRAQRTAGQVGESKSPPRGRAKSGTKPAAGKTSGQRKTGKPGKHGPAVKLPRERPIDPDNPFAALAALKKNLEKTGDR